MLIGPKNICKLFGISVIACCAVFVCTLFLSYNIDLAAVSDQIATPAGQVMYDAQVTMGRVVAAVSGGCLVVTSLVMLLFYIQNYIAEHGRELGILKALGLPTIQIAGHFWVFGLSVLVGCAAGYAAGHLYLPSFYRQQSEGFLGLIEPLTVRPHPVLAAALVAVPAAVFALISVLFACLRLKAPVLDLMRDKRYVRTKHGKAKAADVPFLQDLRSATCKSRKSLVFFVTFSAFCFSAMVQMSFSMNDLAGETFAVMVLSIGLILAFVTLFLSLSAVVRGNAKTVAMMRTFGYDGAVCSHCILGAYRPFACLGFVLGTGYQYALLRLMVSVVFAEIGEMPDYRFSIPMFLVTLVLFAFSYEAVMALYARRIQKLSLMTIMSE